MSIPFPISEYTIIEIDYGIHEINTPYDLTSEVDIVSLFKEYIDVYEIGNLSDPPGYVILCNQINPIENGLYKFYEVDTSNIPNLPHARFFSEPNVFTVSSEKNLSHEQPKVLVGMILGSRLHLYKLCRSDSDTKYGYFNIYRDNEQSTRGDMYKHCFKYQPYKREPIGYVCISHGVIGVDPLIYVKTKCGDIEELRQQIGMLTEKVKSLEQIILRMNSDQPILNLINK